MSLAEYLVMLQHWVRSAAATCLVLLLLLTPLYTSLAAKQPACVSSSPLSLGILRALRLLIQQCSHAVVCAVVCAVDLPQMLQLHLYQPPIP
jgi:hypothetical protein